MISEEALKKAANEAAQAITDSLPAPEECEHEFSLSFQRRMRRIFFSAKHPIIYKLPEYAACFVLAVILVSSTLLTFNAEARAAFFAWVREQYEAFVEYRFIGDTSEDSNVIEYELAWLPDGFCLVEKQILGSSTFVIYIDDSGQRITFSYLQGDDSTSLFMASDYTEVKSVQIGNINADFYQASLETSSNALVWVSEKEDVCFCIMSPLSEDTIIKLAENVLKK